MTKTPSTPHSPMSDDMAPTLPDQWKNWEGTFDDLIVESGKVLAQVAPGTTAPSGSVVRYYQQQGVVGRGTSHGRTKRFGSEELSQVVSAKWLAGQNIPLALAKAAVIGEGQNQSQHPAQALVAQLMQSAGLPGGSGFGLGASPARAAISGSRTLSAGLPRAAFMSQTHDGPLAMTNALFGSSAMDGQTSQDYVSLPAGGTVRYVLDAGTTVELATDGDIQAQAQALQTLATQLLANLSKTSPTS